MFLCPYRKGYGYIYPLALKFCPLGDVLGGGGVVLPPRASEGVLGVFSPRLGGSGEAEERSRGEASLTLSRKSQDAWGWGVFQKEFVLDY